MAERADHERTTDGAAEDRMARRRGRRARSGPTGAVKPSRRMPDRKHEPAAEAAPAEAAAAAPEALAAAATTLSQPLAAAVQASQALAAAPAVPPRIAAVPGLWPSVAVRAGQAALESSLRLQRETFAFAAAQAARNWKAGQALARCGSLPAVLAVQREFMEETMAHGSTCLCTFSRLSVEAVQAALSPPLGR